MSSVQIWVVQSPTVRNIFGSWGCRWRVLTGPKWASNWDMILSAAIRARRLQLKTSPNSTFINLKNRQNYWAYNESTLLGADQKLVGHGRIIFHTTSWQRAIRILLRIEVEDVDGCTQLAHIPPQDLKWRGNLVIEQCWSCNEWNEIRNLHLLSYSLQKVNRIWIVNCLTI